MVNTEGLHGQDLHPVSHWLIFTIWTVTGIIGALNVEICFQITVQNQAPPRLECRSLD